MGERHYRPSVRTLMRPYEIAFGVLGVVTAVGYGVESGDWLNLILVALPSGGFVTWHLLENGTAVDGEGFTSTRFTRSVSLSWPDVQEVRTEPGVRVVVVYDEDGERLPLHDVPANDAEVIRELWAAGRGEDWERTLRLPEPVPAEVTATTGLGRAAASGAGIGVLGLIVVSMLDDQAGLFEVAGAARQDLVAVLLCLVIAPVVAFTASLTLSRRRQRDGQEL
ncbi:PH domain-containing protein [Amycolatopsis lurida]